jgi:maleylpyruvate isomerase
VPTPLDAKQLDACIEGLAATHQRLLGIVDEMDASAFLEPCALPGWSRGTLLGHITRNALSFVHLMECSSRGEVGDQYPGGADARQRGIDEASQWEPAQHVKELRSAIYALEGAWARATFEMWNHTGRSASGTIVAMHELPFLRWRECLVHLVDLNIGYTFEEWPDLYVRRELERQKMAWAASHPMGLTQLPADAMKLNEKLRLAWLLQRIDVEGLPKGPGL